jgi:hypothetical protein
MTEGFPALTVGVFPAAERDRLARLLGALEQAFPVRFEGRRDCELRGLDAVLELGAGDLGRAAAAAGTPALSLLEPELVEAGPEVSPRLSPGPQLDRRLRGAVLPDAYLGPALDSGAQLEPGQVSVLASCGGRPTWLCAGKHQIGLLSPAELGAEEALRERLRDGRSAALLPLVHFLRELTAAIRWRPPAARASLLFDDPNLHWPSYGFVDLAALGEHAHAHGYHAALATVPLDAWFVHPAAARALKQSQGAISLLVHGNNHFGGELGRLQTEDEALSLAAQAQRRAAAFRSRTGIDIESVMVPPHEACSAVTPRGLLRCGFEAITMTLPFPWLVQPSGPWLERPQGVGPLVGWGPADSADGLPVFLRHPLVGRSAAELVLRAFLDQPLILYGHQADLLEGLDVLESAVAEVNRLAPTRWCSLGEIAAGSYETRRHGAQLAVRLLTRRARIEIPAGVERLLVAAPAPVPGRPSELLLLDCRQQGFGEEFSVRPGAVVELALRAGDAVDVRHVPAPRRQPLALPRRVLSEGRDRLAPLLARAR